MDGDVAARLIAATYADLVDVEPGLTLAELRSRLATARSQCAALVGEFGPMVTFDDLAGSLCEPLASTVARWDDAGDDAPGDRVPYIDELIVEVDAALAAFGPAMTLAKVAEGWGGRT